MIQNPVLQRELIRFRLRRSAPVRSGVILAILVGVGWLHWMVLDWLIKNPGSSTGRDAWSMLIGLQFALIALIAPAMAANAISQEREQQTWEMLIFTRLRPKEIIMGKWIARVLPVVAIPILCLPLTLICWSSASHGPALFNLNPGDYGNVTLGQFLLGYLVLLAQGVFFTTVGLFLSWTLRKTLFALMGSYAFIIGFLSIGTALITASLDQFVRQYNFFDQFPLMWINPFWQVGQIFSLSRPDGAFHLFSGIFAYLLLTAGLLAVMIRRFKFSEAR